MDNELAPGGCCSHSGDWPIPFRCSRIEESLQSAFAIHHDPINNCILEISVATRKKSKGRGLVPPVRRRAIPTAVGRLFGLIIITYYTVQLAC